MDEFKLIDNFLKKLSGKNSLNLEDDVALLDSDAKLAFSTDIIVEDVHFFKNSSAKIIAYKLLESALSDLAAKALCPCYYSLNLSLPKNVSSEWFELFSLSLSEIQKKHNIYLLGGDITNCEKMVLSATVFGTYKQKIIARNNLQENDLVFLSGYIGDSYLGLEYLRGNLTEDLLKKYFIDKYNFPEARTDLRNILANYANAAIDISDGLIQDISHLAKTSKKQVNIDYSSIAYSDNAKKLISKNNDLIYKLPFAGDDYEIVFSVASENRDALLKLAQKSKILITEIGYVSRGNSVKLLNCDNKKLSKNWGYKHFTD